MIRTALRVFLLATVAIFAVGTMAEAAPKKVLHHRARHSARVSTGSAASARRASHKKHVTHHTSSSKVVRHRPSTKPR
jgi:hypothetical protein